jgi:hypothetical protein
MNQCSSGRKRAILPAATEGVMREESLVCGNGGLGVISDKKHETPADDKKSFLKFGKNFCA